MRTKSTKGKKARQPLEYVGTYFDSTDISPISELVKNEIDLQGLTFEVVAGKAEVCTGTVSRLYHGFVRQPQMRTCVAILEALGYRVQVVGG